LINTFLLLASLALTAWWASGGKDLELSGRGPVFWGILVGLLGVLTIGVSGALTALGDTLFPVSSLAEGVAQDFSPTAHFLIRLRLLHPSIAVIVGAYLILFTGLMNLSSFGRMASRLTRLLTVLILMQGAAGLVNLALLAPVWMQLVHLFLADSVWITLVFLAASLFPRQAPEKTREMRPAPAFPKPGEIQ
jgi:heme A synthase